MSDLVITNETDTNIQFDRDSCFLVLTFSPTNKDLGVQFFYCTGSSSSNGSNENLRGNGSGKRLMLDAFIYMQQKHGNFETVSIFPVPKYDPYQIEQIYKDEIERYMETDDEMRTRFEEEVMYRSDYQPWVNMNRYYELQRDIDAKIEQYRKEQEEKLVRYYKSLGFSGDGPIYYGNFTDIINTISQSMTAKGYKKGKKKGTKRVSRRGSKRARKASKQVSKKRRQ
jgi:hypothetical protein